ncbi:MAG: [protein-PII] uridylyltransferase, partial [Deltaproteobacteria bacterium]|nr:[protein-PII] uridylyltransferase [Deltaproteobacteria bacterium]
MAAKDFDVFTPLLDARFVCGISHLYSNLMDQMGKTVISKNADRFTTWLVKRNQARHQRFGDSANLLEPNIKEGRGGLRDYHTMLWIAGIRSDIRQRRDLEYYGYLSHGEYNELIRALKFVWRVRNHLHRLTGRKCDQLYFEYQVKLAEALNFQKIEGWEPVERFLGVLHDKMECIKQQHLMFLYELGISATRQGRHRVAKKTRVKGLTVNRGKLAFVASRYILSDPKLLVTIFEESVSLNIPLNVEARRLIKDFLYLVDKKFRRSGRVMKSFERILVASAPEFNVLSVMLNTGLLAHLIPGFKGIINRIQFDSYHIFPVGRHSLRTVKTIKSFGTDEDISGYPFCGDLYKKMKKPKILLWAALLHDIGKGISAGGHSLRGAAMVHDLLTARGQAHVDVERICFLVKEHLLLMKTATRRDIQDEETAISCARIIKDAKVLKMLYLLSVADAIATGPKAWNDWTATLLRDLFVKVLNIIENGELATREALEILAVKKKLLLGAARSPAALKEYESLFQMMSPRYQLTIDVEDMMDHVLLYRKLKDADFVWNILQARDSNTRRVVICARDRPGLFSKIAGVFTLNSLDILAAQVFTWRDNIALDIFEVKAPRDLIFEDRKWAETEQNLQDVLSERLDLASLLTDKLFAAKSAKSVFLRPCKIVVDNETSNFYTIIEVHAHDFQGFLYQITDALLRCRLDVWVAKIATQVDQVVDVFYVRDFDGRKVDM